MSAALSLKALRRDPDHGVVAGVCAGLGRGLGVDPLLLRIGFGVLAVATGGVGCVLYAIAWALMPAATAGAVPMAVRPRGPGGRKRTAAGVGLLVLSVLLLFRALGVWWSDALIWPLVLAASGAALIWRHSTLRAVEEAPAPAARPARLSRRHRGAYRGGFGIALVIGAGLLFLYANGALDKVQDAALGAIVVLVALALILAPFWWRLGRNLAAERGARIRSQERAELAAHLHDSVLQTLALVQKRSDDPREVAALARRQERELRSWLNGEPRIDGGLAAALQATAVDVEETHGVPIDVVAVGDLPLDEDNRALVAAAREAMVNAAKFAGGTVAVYTEVADERVQVFVHDRGPGFDPDAVPDDRRGVRESIMGRMERHGGHAMIRSTPGVGTEVELTLERQP